MYFRIAVFCVALVLIQAEQPIQTLQYYNELLANVTGTRIIGGRPASVGQFPYQVAIVYTTPVGNFFCGGTLINQEWVMTAAHCAADAISFTMYFGGLTLGSAESGREVEVSTEKVVHPDFNPSNLNNDIALIHLPQPIALTNRISPVQLPTQHEITLPNIPVTVVGWGRTSDNSNAVSQTLNYVELETISNAQCAQIYGNSIVSSTTICAVGDPHHSTCVGDSGGPMIEYYPDGTAVQVGIISFVNTAGCASGYPSGYVRTEGYKEWINHHANVPV